MISHAYRCIFIHQRKCAGTSIIDAFGFGREDPDRHFMNDGVLSDDYAQRPAGYLVFSVVRNPWDRFVSGWRYCRGTRHRSLLEVLRDPPAEGHDYRHLTRPQHAILLEPEGRPAYDVLLRFETLQDDFDALCERLGKPRRRLAQLNPGRRHHYSRYFDEQTRSLFEQRFARDIEAFGYRFEPRAPDHRVGRRGWLAGIGSRPTDRLTSKI